MALKKSKVNEHSPLHFISDFPLDECLLRLETLFGDDAEWVFEQVSPKTMKLEIKGIFSGNKVYLKGSLTSWAGGDQTRVAFTLGTLATRVETRNPYVIGLIMLLVLSPMLMMLIFSYQSLEFLYVAMAALVVIVIAILLQLKRDVKVDITQDSTSTDLEAHHAATQKQESLLYDAIVRALT